MGCGVLHSGTEEVCVEVSTHSSPWKQPLLFLSSTPAEFFDEEGREVDLNFGGLRGRGVKKQDPPIERDLYLSLEDLFFGCTKKIKISRRVSTCLAPPGSHYLSPPISQVTSPLSSLETSGMVSVGIMNSQIWRPRIIEF